jgi:Tol biopolymer transport system component
MVVGLASPAQAYSRPGTIEWISVSTDGDFARGSFEPNHVSSMSRDARYVVFGGWSRRLAPEWLEGTPFVRPWLFLRDRATGVTELLSITHDNRVSQGGERAGSISADGRYVAFNSSSSITPGGGGIFLRDRAEETVERISVTAEGEAPSGSSGGPRMTPDARYVTFHSAAQLVPSAKWNGQFGGLDVYVRDLAAGITERVSVASGGEHALGTFMFPRISDDGRFVAFESDSPELDPPNPSREWRVYLHDRETKTTTLVSRAPDGSPPDNWAFLSDMSPDGRLILFETIATNLVPNKSNESSFWGGPASDVYLHDRETGEVRRVSVSGTGAEGNDDSWAGRIGADGRTILFSSDATNIVDVDENGRSDVFAYDLVTGATEIVSVAADGSQGNRNSFGGVINAEGSTVAFNSIATNLVEGIGNNEPDVFARYRGPALGARFTGMDQSEDEVALAGWAYLSGAVLASAENTPSGDPFVDATSASLAGASLIYRHEGDSSLQARLDLDSVSQLGGPGVVYAMRFSTAAGDWEARVTTLTSNFVRFDLMRCEAVCVEHDELAGGYATTGDQVRITIPLDTVGLNPDDEITDISAYTAFTAAGEVTPLEETALPDARVPSAAVTLGIAPAGVSEDQVAFDTAAELAAADFSGVLDISSLSPGDYEVWAKACLDELCGPAASAPLTVEGEPEPEIKDTVLELTVTDQGQSMALNARLTELDSSDAIAGRTIDFYSDGELIGSRATDGDGVATVAVPPGHRGANRTYEAVFEGDDFYRASSDTRPGRRGGQGDEAGQTAHTGRPSGGMVSFL